MSWFAIRWVDAAGYLASALVFATFCMRTMIALRVAAIGSNICFIGFGVAAHVYPVLLLHIVLLPLNAVRAMEMFRLTQQIEVGKTSFEPFRPFMTAERYTSGDILFHKGDFADKMFLISAGNVLVEDVDITLGPGDLVGEIGVFSSEQKRTSTVRCLSDTELMSIAKEHIAQICFQHPEISFHLLSLITNRLLVDISIFNRHNEAGRDCNGF